MNPKEDKYPKAYTKAHYNQMLETSDKKKILKAFWEMRHTMYGRTNTENSAFLKKLETMQARRQ